MIALGLRLSLSGGRRGLIMLSLTIAAIAVGTNLLLLASTISPAMQNRANRTAWQDAGFLDSRYMVSSTSQTPHTIISSTTDTYHASTITVVDLFGSALEAPVPAGITFLPHIGQVLVSPALANLLKRSPDLKGRYGIVVGLVGDRALTGPDDLLAVRGVPRDAAAVHGMSVSKFPTHGQVLQLTGILRLLLLLGAVAMLAPVALLVALATRLSAATRDRRLAALRLAGATAKQMSSLAGVESLLAGSAGVLAGVAMFFVTRPAATFVTYNGGRWFTSDLTPGWPALIGVLVAVPVVTVFATRLTLSAVAKSPLGIARRSQAKTVRGWRLLPLAASITILGLVLSGSSPVPSRVSHSQQVIGSFFLLLVCLVYAGPWVTGAVGAVLAHSNGPAGLLAGRRLQDDPRAGFRAIAGVVLAILVTTMFAATTPAAADSLRTTPITGQQDGTAQAALPAATRAVSDGLLRQISQIGGVAAATLVYQGLAQDGTSPANVWIGDCPKIVAASRLNSVPCGAASTIILATNRAHLLTSSSSNLEVDNLASAVVSAQDQAPPAGSTTTLTVRGGKVALMPEQTGIDVPGAIVSPAIVKSVLGKFRPTLLLISYRTQAALEQVRSVMLRQAPGSQVSTRESAYKGYSSDIRHLYRVVTLASIGAFGLAGFGLVVAVATGLLERRRPFALLRASGTPLRVLQRTAYLEAFLPLLVMSVLAWGLGALVGHWAVSSKGTSRQLPWLSISEPVVLGLGLALLVTSAALPLVGRATATEETRFD